MYSPLNLFGYWTLNKHYYYIVLGGYLRILGVAPVFNHVAHYQYLYPAVYLFMADIANSELFVCCCRICLLC